MYNLYTGSATSRASLSFSFNDCPQNCSSSFNGGYPSSSCSCCCCACSCCSSIPINTVNCSRLVPVNPSPFYGFRQSTLIQLPLSRRRLILSGGAPVGDLGPTRSAYGRLACIRDVGFDRIRDQGLKSKGKGIGLWGYCSVEERYAFHKVSAACDDAEAMLSLLAEGSGEEDFGVPERRKKKKKKKASSSSSKEGKVRDSVVHIVRKERVNARRLEGYSWDGLENVKAQAWKELCRVNCQEKDFVKGEDSRLREGDRIGSLYYSFPDSDDSDVKTKRHGECVKVGLIGSEKESRKRVGVLAVNKQRKDELERQRIEKHQILHSGRRDDIEVETSAGLDLRKKSNRKLRKELIEEIVSGKESVLNQSRLSEAHVNSSQTGLSMKKQYNYKVGESISDVNSSFGYSRTDNRVSETSDPSYKYERVTENSGFVDEKTVVFSSKVSGSEEHVVSDSEFCRTCGQVTSGNQAGSSKEQQSKFQQIECDSAGFISSSVETKAASEQEERSSLTQKSADEVSRQHNQLEHLVASSQVNLRKSENYTVRADAAESYEENTSISRRHAKISEIDSTNTRLTSTVKQQSDTRTNKQEETSTLIQTSLKEVNERSHQKSLVAISQTELMRENQKRIEIVNTGHSNLRDTSRTQQQQEALVKGSEENTILISSQLAKVERYQQTDFQIAGRKQSREESKVLSGSSQGHVDETTVNSSSASEERLHFEQSYLTEKEVNEKSRQESLVAISQAELMRKNQKRIEIVDSGYSSVQDTSRTQQQQEARVKGSEEKTILISSQLAKGERYQQTDIQVTGQKQSREELEVRSGSSQVHIDETVVNSSSASEERLHYEQSYLTEKVKETHEHIKETIKQTELIYVVQPALREPGIVKKETSRYPYVTSTSQVRIEEIDEEEDQRNLPSDLSPRLTQPPQSTEVHPVYLESASRFSSQDSSINSEAEVHPVYLESASRFSSQDSSRNSEGESSIYVDPLGTDESPHDDLLGSAERMDILYHQVIGDFVENIMHEKSTSVIEMEKKSPKRSSSGFGTGKEPTDETLTLQQPPAGEASENAATPHSGIVRRSGRALWNVAANIVRLRWGVLSESRKSTVKSGGQSSLSDSVGSESLLSGYDPNDAHGGNMKMGILRAPLKPSSAYQPLLVRTTTESSTDKPIVSNLSDNTRLDIDSALSPSFGGVFGETSTELNVGDNSGLAVDSSLSPSSGVIFGDANVELNVGDNPGLAVDSSLSTLFGSISGQTNTELNVGHNTGLAVDSSLLPSFGGGGSGETNILLNVDEMSSQAPASIDWTQSAAMQFRRSHRLSDASYELHKGGTEVTGGVSGEANTELYVGSNTGLAVGGSPLPSFGGGSVNEMSSQATVSLDWTQSAAMQVRRSHRRSDAIYEMHEGGTEATGSGTEDQIKGDLDASLVVISGSEENENVAVQEGKNLLRSDQVMKERFDEWGEVHRLEIEQRSIDQTFMREALEEAKKSADMWEFPVGAVLVQHGKIIARGHNLVEELRDSTAHAEISCIREASSILKTWRLSETALYVTLEPCAMCAGAILQARIGTLVYGAPNKLLGADGSWVRLFPGSVDGEGGSESTGNQEGPVHPFHPKMMIRRGILETECAELIQQSFKLRKKKGKTSEQPDEKRSNRKVHHPSKLLHKMHHMFLFCL